MQGVGYRAWLVALARGRGLAGWVRNCKDGSVEAVVAGDAAAVASVIEACGRGPTLANVAAVATEPLVDETLPERFEQRLTL